MIFVEKIDELVAVPRAILREDAQPGKLALARFECQFAAPHDAARAEGLQPSELPVIELRKGDALRIAVELLVFVEFGHGRIRWRTILQQIVVLRRYHLKQKNRVFGDVS